MCSSASVSATANVTKGTSVDLGSDAIPSAMDGKNAVGCEFEQGLQLLCDGFRDVRQLVK